MIEILQDLLTGFQPTPTNIVFIAVLLLAAWFVFSRWESR